MEAYEPGFCHRLYLHARVAGSAAEREYVAVCFFLTGISWADGIQLTPPDNRSRS